MNTAHDLKLSVDDLAGRWTEPALKILKAAGVGPISIEMELEAWHSLKKVLSADLRLQQMFGFSLRISMSTLMEQTLRKAVLRVARAFKLPSMSRDFEKRVGQLAEQQRATAVKQGFLSAIVRLPAAPKANRESRRPNLVPRAVVAAIGG